MNGHPWKKIFHDLLEVGFQEIIKEIELHTFADASSYGVGAIVVAIVRQESGTSKGLVAAKSHLAKDLTIPRLEFVPAHMVTNLVPNVKKALDGFPIRNVFGLYDSTVALHWIRNGRSEDLKQFVENRVRKIQEKNNIQWRHIPRQDNPADLASR